MEAIAPLLVAGALMVIAASWVAPRIRVPAPLLLVVVGIGCSFIPGLAPAEIDPEWILVLVLPPVLYAAAVNVPTTDFRRDLRSITGLSVALVIISAIVVGLLLTWLLPGLPLAAAIALGAVVAPPDAVAATAIGKRLGLPARIVMVLEGEGLVNDATALVLLRSAIAALTGGFTLLDAAGDFAFSVVCALVIGTIVGYCSVWVRARMDQPTLTTAISFTVPFLAFLPAEALHASGVLAVVVAGLITSFGSPRHLTAQDRISERMNWRTIQLILENGVFLVMGYQMAHIIDDADDEGLGVGAAVTIGLIVTLVLLLIRVLFTAPLMLSLHVDQFAAARRITRLDHALDRLEHTNPTGGTPSMRSARQSERLRRRRAEWQIRAQGGFGWRGGAVIAWSGMRGVVTIAAAQSLPVDTPSRAQLVLIAFTVALTTLLLYGGTLPLLIRTLKITGPDQPAQIREVQALIDEIVTAGAQRLRSDDIRKADGRPFDALLVDEMITARAAVAAEFWELRVAEPSASIGQRAALFDEMLRAEQAALADARDSGRYSSTALALAQLVLDTEQARTVQGPMG